MSFDIQWTNELFNNYRDKKSQDLIEWLGKISEEEKGQNGDRALFLLPHNDRIERIIVNLEDDQINRIRIEGNPFSLPFFYLQGLTKEYKSTFNTYDAIDDQQFFFYPSKHENSITAIDSWISIEQQNNNIEDINFQTINFYFSREEEPYHFRTGWLMIKK
jgi:hypothetical protein